MPAESALLHIHRCLTILAAMSRGDATLDDLAARLDVNRRTVMRDLKFLRALGARFAYSARSKTWAQYGYFDFWEALRREATRHHTARTL